MKTLDRSQQKALRTSQDVFILGLLTGAGYGWQYASAGNAPA